METALYDMLRHFADSWGLLYMMAIFLTVVFLIVRPGAPGSTSRIGAAFRLTADCGA